MGKFMRNLLSIAIHAVL